MTEVLRGEFTIDRVRAREKLSRYQLADPYAYVLELVQSAFLRGARTIRFEFDSDDMILSFDGEPYSETDLSHLEMAILEDADSRAARSRRQLAIGLLAAEALNPKLIIVDSQGGYRLAVRQGESERLNPSSRTPPGTVIQVRERWRPKLLLKFWQNLREKGREQLLIREHCCSAAKPIFIGDDLVSQRPHGAPNGLRYGEVSIETEGFSGWGGFIAGEESELHLLCEGVLVERVPLQLGPLPFRAVISGEKLEKDLSGGAVRRNSGFKEMMVEVERARKRALQIFCRQNPTEFREQARRELLEVGSVKKMQDEDVYPGCLAKLRVWNLANGEYATFEELLAARRTHGFLPYSLESLGQHALPEMPVIWLWDKELLPKLKNMVYLRNVTRRLRKLRTAELNREKWLATPTEPKLSGPGYLAIAELNHQGIRGEVGIRKSGGPPLIRFIKNGCLLAELTPTFWPLGVEVVVEADFQPNSSFNGVRADEVAARTVARALAPLPGLFERVAQPRFFEFFWSRPQETLDMLGDYVRVRAQPNCFDRMLESCQISAQDFPELERPEGWQDGELDQDSSLLDVRWLKTENGEKRSLRELSREAQSRSRLVLNPTQRKTLENILGDDFLQPPVGHSKSKTEATEFVADEKWLQEEYFLTAFRTELRSVKEKDHDLLISNLRISRILLTDLEKEKAVKLDDSDYILLNRNHPLVQEALTCYEAQPGVLIYLISLVFSALNRATARVSDEDESLLQNALLDHCMSRNASHQRARACKTDKPSGYLEPFCDSGYGTGWAHDPSGLGLRFYIEQPSTQTRPLMIIDLDSPRKEGGHDFLFELPKEWLDGRRLKIWACLLKPDSGELYTLPGSPRTFAPPVGQPTPPVGWLEEVTEQGCASGWCLDPNQPATALRVEFYLDGNHAEGEYVGGCSADLARPEVLELTGYRGDHGFSFQVPQQYQDGAEHKLWAYTFDAEKVSINPLLKGAPLSWGSRSAAPRPNPDAMKTARRVLERTRLELEQARRCKGLTAKGEQCRRTPGRNSPYCYQHKK